MQLGISYYPEYYPQEQWDRHFQVLVEGGFKRVRFGESSWATFQPSRQEFRWEILDDAIEKAASFGVEVVLGTPTYVPPVWLVKEHPEALPVGADGRHGAGDIVSVLMVGEREGVMKNRVIKEKQGDARPGRGGTSDECAQGIQHLVGVLGFKKFVRLVFNSSGTVIHILKFVGEPLEIDERPDVVTGDSCGRVARDMASHVGGIDMVPMTTGIQFVVDPWPFSATSL